MTSVAAEGFPLNAFLSRTVANEARDFARLIVELYNDESWNAKLSSVARRIVRQHFSQKQADVALATAIAPLASANGIVLPMRYVGKSAKESIMA
jgi:predicted DNA-binding ribbon-helix-helix protein